ncbi:response regulator transcription factor [Azoarcus sp. KH32C]|uniref:response regulator transcription factor n=1 Tax=Azoarcus sp. KH32C TaxID=748247 RepID=UPI0002386D71|nr:response regulator transcription factor [Azoarcus sp. KH32C]BAL23870.1 two-component transcriptional regulator, LuxR family [Azoarcus sp. KH32C]
MGINLVLVDPSPVVLLGLVHAFGAEADFTIQACVQDCDNALQAVRQFAPDIVVLDLMLPEKNGIELIRALKRERSPSRPVVFAMRPSAKDALEVVRLGVRGVVTKDMALHWLVRCIREVHAGRQWLEKEIAVHAIGNLLETEEANREIASVLTPREIQVARMVSQGLPNKTVAGRLDISEGTAKLHLHHIYRKLQLNGRIALVRYMQKAGL